MTTEPWKPCESCGAEIYMLIDRDIDGRAVEFRECINCHKEYEILYDDDGHEIKD